LIDARALADSVELVDFQKHLRVELAERGIDACETVAGSAAMAALRVEHEEESSERFRLTLVDAVTGKTTLRILDLSSIPGNGRALALGICANELLLASWAELGLREAPATGVQVPVAVRQTLEAREAVGPKLRRRLHWFGVSFSGQAFSARERALGPDLGLSRLMGAGFSLRGRLGFRQAARLPAPDGEVDVWSARADVALGLDLVSPSPLGLGAFVGADLSRYSISGDPKPDAVAYSSDVLATSLNAGLTLRFAISPAWRALLEASGGHSLRGVHARDGSVQVGSFVGPFAGLALGLEVGL
jgi:hypothetical protein